MTLNEILSPVSSLIGWTLIHSLWQAALITLIISVTLRFVPLRYSKFRYMLACAGMLMSIVCALVTFIVISAEEKAVQQVLIQTPSATPLATTDIQQAGLTTLQNVKIYTSHVLNTNMSLIVSLWALGMLAFSVRVFTGWWTINRLRSQSDLIEGHWYDHLEKLARGLGINSKISLAENTRITTPMVIGFVKPIILVPTGMLTGLSAEQVETIFLHELAHIKRYDYAINLLQVFIETILFFNPFVWILSNIIRREREYCCDDEVVSVHGSTIDYARALAQLEEWKLSKSTFALALAANKNQLLNRIKRIMEKSGQNYSSRERLIPVVLLVIGLVCASWLTVQKTDTTVSSKEDNAESADTTIKKSGRTTIISFDEDGEPHELTRVYEHDEDDTDLFVWAPAVPPTPPIFEIPAIEAIPSAPGFPAFPAFPADVWHHGLYHDTIPGAWHRSGKDWEEFSEQFEKEFSEKFEDFYKKHEKDFDKMMKSMEEKFKADFEAGDIGMTIPVEEMRLAELEHIRSLDALEHLDLEELQLAQERALDAVQEVPQLPALAGLDNLALDLQEMQSRLATLDDRMQDFQQELKKSLIADGYLKAGEEIKSINWEENLIEINGKKIKDADAKKYREKHDKFFDDDIHINRIE